MDQNQNPVQPGQTIDPVPATPAAEMPDNTPAVPAQPPEANQHTPSSEAKSHHEPHHVSQPSHNAPQSSVASDELEKAAHTIESLKQAYGKVIVGQEELLDSILVTLISSGHILIEGVPGLAKTTAVRALAQALDANFVRIQCTPDMLPSDIIGNQIYNPEKHEFVTQIGPINHQFVLVDEINRTGAKTQSALLEAMQEREISIGGENHKLPDGFLVLATQNPIEQEGTYLLPEAQLDRFLIKHIVTYPTIEEEVSIMQTHNSSGQMPEIEKSASVSDVLALQETAKKITVDDKIMRYIAGVSAATRFPENYGLQDLKPYIEFGASPRASIALVAAARASALMQKQGYVTPDHVKPYLTRILRHRIGLTYEAEAENISADQIIEKIGASVAVP